MQILLRAIRAGAIAGTGGDKSADPYNELVSELNEIDEGVNDG